MDTLFHLAFPVHDFDLAKKFYRDQLGFNIGRESANALIFQFATHQIVAHKTESPIPPQQSIYPRHFGLIFLRKDEFEAFFKQLKSRDVIFEIPLKTRFSGTKIEHQSFFLKDPSNNLLEFKYYIHHSAIFGEHDYSQVGEN
ncbi:glyoxalase [Legionella israelensis]|uniref:Glyoxalase n=1 Tax=Legionella israelensis TaxID=454 RepID=A0A0W0WNX1_9GAMM|nr:VOC family protein [Legionella israelensis]KTD34032.1 Glyoxalase/Bleomycin resistance family protein [Legionella israelensis]QBR84561.1 glyoxalase [Legionella israelensis]QBS10634.1 glyoxalase [Legionella israelensis]SCX84915.1 hypothetical protein SAMN02746069_00433 [Legionella israelensis DSM 19235]STX57587.1 Glyoxalase/Bleomycin resistance family protein [Legionella israelensis]